jgi:hypothetical protein
MIVSISSFYLCYAYCILIHYIIREKKERINDPNIEYVDMDDFRPGGKHGPKEEDPSVEIMATTKSSINPEIAQELRKASEVVASAIQVG